MRTGKKQTLKEKWDFQTIIESRSWGKPQEKDLFYWNRITMHLVDENGSVYLGRQYQDVFLCQKDELARHISYHPLEETTLFLQFASIPCTDSALAQWVNEHGRLTDWAYIKDLRIDINYLNSVTSSDHRFLPIAFTLFAGNSMPLQESKRFYQTEHFWIKYAVYLWECITTRNTNMLFRVLETDNKGENYINDHTGPIIKTDVFDHLFQDGDTEEWVQEEIKENMQKFFRRIIDETGPSFFLDGFEFAERMLERSINRAFFEYPVNTYLDRSNPALVLEPTSLLSSMWYQLALATKSKTEFRRCEICGQWEDMDGHRTNWTKHKQCANNEAVKRYRKKGK
jgi:hypothetical protein